MDHLGKYEKLSGEISFFRGGLKRGLGWGSTPLPTLHVPIYNDQLHMHTRNNDQYCNLFVDQYIYIVRLVIS